MITPEIIREIVDENAGGIKFTELLVKLLTDYRSMNGMNTDEFIEEVEKVILITPHIKILEYISVIGEDTVRHKMFVYRDSV